MYRIPALPLEFLLSLRKTASPPKDVEIKNMVRGLVGKGQYDLAYYAWLQFLPAAELSRVGLLYNGSFEAEPSGMPFDWTIHQGTGTRVEISDAPQQSSGRALKIEFGHGRIDFRGVSQVMMLAPGSYRFKGRYIGSVLGRRGLLWRITCLAPSRNHIGETPMINGIARDWKDFDLVFEVPQNCRSQNISLVFDARSASERFVSGTIWFDDLNIVRESDRAKN